MAKVPQQNSKVEAHSSSRAGALRLKVSPGILCLLIILPGVVVFGAGFAGFWIRNHQASGAAPTPSISAAGKVTSTTPLHSGPWGLLEAQPTYLQIPDECLETLTAAAPRWIFKGYSRQRVLNLFASAGMSEAGQSALGDSRFWQVQPQQVTLTPPPAVVLGLSPSTRSIIYTALAQFPENALHQAPFFWRTKDEATLLAQPAFSETVRTIIRQLSYQKGNLSLFADVEVLTELFAENNAELRNILKELSRKPAVIPRLHVTPETDMEAMMRYWGVAGLTKIMRPALEAVTRIPQGRTVTFLAVLPPFARERLNTYPDPSDNDGHDGFWTVANFFNDRPAAAAVDPVAWNRKLSTDYFNVFTDPRYGDILVIARPTGEVLQTGVYLADDLVFTRLGATRWEPWLITTIPDLLEVSSIRLAHQETPAISYYRNKIF